MSATLPVIAATSPIPTLNREELFFCVSLLALCGVFGPQVSRCVRCPKCGKKKLSVVIDLDGDRHHFCQCGYVATWCNEWTPPNPTLREPVRQRYHRNLENECVHSFRFGECAVCADDPSFRKEKGHPRGQRSFSEDGWRVPPRHQPEFDVNGSMIPDREWVYDPDALDILGVPIHPNRHGVTDWIDQQDMPVPDQQIFSTDRDVITKALHREEVAELERSRHMNVGGNTGAGCNLASHIRSLTTEPPESASPGFLVGDYGALHWHTLRIARRLMSEAAPQGEDVGLMKQELRGKRKQVTGYYDEAESPLSDWQIDVDDDPADTSYDPGKPAFNKDTPRTFIRGKDQNKTDDERFHESQVWKMVCQELAKRLKAGEGWSPTDPREHDRVLPNGVKINLENRRVREILYEIDLHWGNYDSRGKRKLATAYGLKYETLRKRELMSISGQKQCPTTPFTKEQIEHLEKKNGRAVFVHVVADKPRWFILDMDKHETYQDAIQAIKREGVDEALRKTPMWQNDRAPKAKHTAVLKEVWARWNEWFRPANLYVLDLRTPLVVAIAEEAWEVATT